MLRLELKVPTQLLQQNAPTSAYLYLDPVIHYYYLRAFEVRGAHFPSIRLSLWPLFPVEGILSPTDRVFLDILNPTEASRPVHDRISFEFPEFYFQGLTLDL